MRGFLTLLTLSFITAIHTHGQNSHLLIYSQGDGAMVRSKGGSQQLTKASFLPNGSRISVRPRSGIETLARGFQFRFGAGTSFTLDHGVIDLSEGAVLINSKRLSNDLTLKSPESAMGFRGVGWALFQVEPNGGFKAVGLLGKIVLSENGGQSDFTLLPGQLVFLMPGGRGFGQEVSVNLANLIDTSYLVSGFPNSSIFLESLATVTEAQEKMVGKTYGAVVGSAREAESFEVVPTSHSSASAPLRKEGSNLESPSPAGGDPLSELLGRSPTRMNAVPKESSPPPFPSKLFQGID